MDSAIKLFGAQLRKAREALNYTQKQVGSLIGVDGNNVALYERGEQGIRWNTMERIFAELGQPPSYYFSDQAPTEPRSSLITRILVALPSLENSELNDVATFAEGFAESSGRGKPNKLGDEPSQ